MYVVRRSLALLPSTFTAVVVAFALLSSAGADTTTYTVIDLGTLPGGSTSSASSINDKGQVSGKSSAVDENGVGQRAFFMDGMSMINLGIPPGTGTSSAAMGLNNLGAVVVNGNLGFPHAFLWFEQRYTELTSLRDALDSEGRAVNDVGHVVGSVLLTAGGSYPHHAFLYDGSEMSDLNPMFGGDYSDASDINDAGTIVGEARFADNLNVHGYMIKDGMVTNLGPERGITSEASAINDNDVIVGGTYFDGLHEHPMRWIDGTMVDLGLLPGATAGSAEGLNDSGVIVGYCIFNNGQKKAFVYRDGQMTALNDLIPASPQWNVREADGINALGQIAATARNEAGHDHAVILAPVTICEADLNGDGAVDASDLAQVLGSWGPCADCTNDLNGDGVIDGSEIAVVLGAWGSCP